MLHAATVQCERQSPRMLGLHVDTCKRHDRDVAATQNLTIPLPVKTLKRARIAVARRGTSISALVAEKINEVAAEDDRYEVAKRQALRVLARGFRLGGRLLSRDAAHRR
jgi:hypothetical protein